MGVAKLLAHPLQDDDPGNNGPAGKVAGKRWVVGAYGEFWGHGETGRQIRFCVDKKAIIELVGVEPLE